VGLNIEDVTETDEGLQVRIRRSKTDQEGIGRTIGVPFFGSHPVSCPVRAVRAWRLINAEDSRPLFRSVAGQALLGGRLSDRNVARMVKAGAERIGLDLDGGPRLEMAVFSGSCRCGNTDGVPLCRQCLQMATRDEQAATPYLFVG